MKTSNIIFPLYALLVLAFIWLSVSHLASNSPEVNNYIKHYPDGIKTDTVQITEDSLWYPSMNEVHDSAWVWITDAPIISKPE